MNRNFNSAHYTYEIMQKQRENFLKPLKVIVFVS